MHVSYSTGGRGSYGSWFSFVAFCIKYIGRNGNRTFRHFDVLPPGRFAPIVDVSPSRWFATRTVRHQDVSPPGWFAPWIIRPLDVSPHGRFAHMRWTINALPPKNTSNYWSLKMQSFFVNLMVANGLSSEN